MGLVLSKYRQKTSIDLKEAMSLPQTTKQEYGEIRLNAVNHFGEIFEKVKSLAKEMYIEINIPRILKR